VSTGLCEPAYAAVKPAENRDFGIYRTGFMALRFFAYSGYSFPDPHPEGDRHGRAFRGAQRIDAQKKTFAA
jgi:hypothetical protein